MKCILETSIYTKQAVGKTPNDLAVENGHRELYEMLSLIGDELMTTSRTGDAEGVRNYLRKGAEVNSRDQNGWSSLHRAAFKGKSENVKVIQWQKNHLRQLVESVSVKFVHSRERDS
ncbi:Protein VAPYRIN [Linum perenne]